MGKTKSRVKKKRRRMLAARLKNEKWCREQPHVELPKKQQPKWGFVQE